MQSQASATIDVAPATRAAPNTAAARRRVGFDDTLGGEVAQLMAGIGPAPPPAAASGTGEAAPAGGQVVPPGGNILPMPHCPIGEPLARPPLQALPVLDPGDAPIGRPVDPPADASATMSPPGLDLDALVNAMRAGTASTPAVAPEAPEQASNATTPGAATPPVAGPASPATTAATPPAPVALAAALPAPPEAARPDGRRTAAGSDDDRATRRSGSAAVSATASAAVSGGDGQGTSPPGVPPGADGIAGASRGAALESSGHRGGDTDAGSGDPATSTTMAGASAPYSAATERPAGSSTTSAAGATDVVEQRLDAETGSPRWQRELGQRLVESTTHGIRELRLQLQPEHLGPLEVRLRMHDSQVGVWFGSGSAEVRDALQSALPRLREMFAEGGLTMGGASVGQQSAGARDQSAVARTPVRDERAPSVPAPSVGALRAMAGSSTRLLDAYA